ncbi:MAG: methyl-accepting chemotaxis protein [Candidatus Thorarchaeota archaeon]
MGLLKFLDNIKVSNKLIGTFFIVACISGVVGIFATVQINGLNTSIKEIVEVNVEQADWSMESIIAVESQIMTIHASMLGETEARDEFIEAHNKVMDGFHNLTVLLKGTSQETAVTALETQYHSFHMACNGTSGVFDSTIKYEEAKSVADTQYWALDQLEDETDEKLASLEELVTAYALDNALTPNATLSDNAMELNLIVWRMVDRARMYMAVPLDYSLENNNTREQLRNEYADEISILAETDFVQSGLEKDFTDLLGQAEANFQWALANGSMNTTALTILEDVRTRVVFNSSNQNTSLADAVRSQEDGVFVKQDTLVANWVAATDAMETADSLGSSLQADLEVLELWVGDQLDLAKMAAAQSFNDAILFIPVLTVVAIVIGALSGYFLSRSITNPLSRVVTTSVEVAKGNLKVDTEGIDRRRKDEIGQLGSSFGTMIDVVISLIKQVQMTAEMVASASEELASTSEEVNALSEEIAATIQQVSRGASNQSDLATKSMDDIFKMSEVVDRSLHDIEGILQVIEDIAGQTNILALNAAIEAARAGDYGRGFAVVSDNVRRLAEETKTNAANISTLTDKIVSNIGGNITSLQESLQSFAAQSEEFSASSEQVASAAEQQTAAMNQLTTAAQDLTKMSESLANEISEFKT